MTTQAPSGLLKTRDSGATWETPVNQFENITSDNTWKIFSIEHAKKILGYEPDDDAGTEWTS